MRLHHVSRGSGPPLVLVHGIGDSHRLWSLPMGALVREHEVFAIDLPGFGRSAALRDGPVTVAALARAVLEFMAGQGRDRFHVAGNSLGGGIALELSITGAALSACCLSPIGFVEGWERAFLTGSLRMTRTVSRTLPLGVLRAPSVRRALLIQACDHGERLTPEQMADALTDLAHAPSWDDVLRQIADYRFTGTPRCPVTVAWGEHDRLLPPHQARRAAAALPQARHVTLTGCGHLPTWDDPDQVARVILETARS